MKNNGLEIVVREQGNGCVAIFSNRPEVGKGVSEMSEIEAIGRLVRDHGSGLGITVSDHRQTNGDQPSLFNFEEQFIAPQHLG